MNLKPCPWCQRSLAIVAAVVLPGVTLHHAVCGWAGCSACGPDGETPEDAAQKWNGRAEDPRLQIAIEALKEIAATPLAWSDTTNELRSKAEKALERIKA